jgi:threonine synthase
MTDVVYDLDAVVLRPSENPYVRFFDLLPVRDPLLLPQDARFTPAVHAESLGAALGMSKLYLKDETVLPTGTTKDRMAAVALPFLYERGVRRFTTSSTGNSSSAYAAALPRVPDLDMFVFTAESFRNRLTLPETERVVDVVLRDATFVDAFDASREFAQGHGLTAERGFFNPGRREGLKLAWLEAVEQVPGRIDWYVQAVSSAMGVFGVHKAAHELHQLGLAGAPPRLLCVQEDTCAPMAAAWSDGSDEVRPEHIVARPYGIAAAIQRGDPSRTYPYVHRIVRESAGAITSVPAGQIQKAQELLRDLEGLDVCAAAAAALAGLIQQRRMEEIGPDETVLVNLTGATREGTPPDARTRWIPRRDGRWDLGRLDGADDVGARGRV